MNSSDMRAEGPADPAEWPEPPTPIVLRRTQGLTEAVQSLVWTVIALEGVLALLTWWQYAVHANRRLDYLTDLAAVDVVVMTAQVVWFVVFLAAGISIMVLTWRQRFNADQMAAADHRRRRGWAVWGWIVPIVSLWFPYQVTSDTYRASDPDRHPVGRDLAGTAPRYVLGWWLAFLAYLVTDRVIARTEDTLVWAIMQTVALVVAAVAGWFFLRLARETDGRQLRRASGIAIAHPGTVMWR